jgi:hypothetical protein
MVLSLIIDDQWNLISDMSGIITKINELNFELHCYCSEKSNDFILKLGQLTYEHFFTVHFDGINYFLSPTMSCPYPFHLHHTFSSSPPLG